MSGDEVSEGLLVLKMVREGKFWGHLQFTQHLCKAVRGCNLRDGSCIDRLGLQGIWIAATFEGRPSRSFRQQLRTTEGLQRKCSHVMCWKHAPGPEEQPRDLTPPAFSRFMMGVEPFLLFLARRTTYWACPFKAQAWACCTSPGTSGFFLLRASSRWSRL